MTTPDRVDRMVAYLLKHRAEIEAIPFGALRFDFAHDDVKVRLERADKLPATAPAAALVR